MNPGITELVTGSDNVEIIRDRIAEILAIESTGQQALAEAATPKLDPNPWKLRVFTERATPWEFFQNVEDPACVSPVVNVWFDNATIDGRASNVVERQKHTGVFNIDCYAYGVAYNPNDGTSWQVPADEAAARARDRAVRLCRRFLMAGTYTYLGLRGTVWRRMVQSITSFQPAIESQPIARVVAGRIALAVDFNEFSPQVVGLPLESISVSVKRKETGEIYVTATYDADS